MNLPTLFAPIRGLGINHSKVSWNYLMPSRYKSMDKFKTVKFKCPTGKPESWRRIRSS
jgi:hypothetical protein